MTASVSPSGERAALALITDLYAQVVDLRAQLEQERHQHTALTQVLQRQLDDLRSAVRTEAGVPGDEGRPPGHPA